jgi:hypothetical protein
MHQFLSMPGHEEDLDIRNGDQADYKTSEVAQGTFNINEDPKPPTFMRNNYDEHKIESFKNFQHIDHEGPADEEAEREAVQRALAM